MPIYKYQCPVCYERYEVICSMSERNVDRVCSVCYCSLERLVEEMGYRRDHTIVADGN